MPRDHQKSTELVAVSITLPSWRTSLVTWANSMLTKFGKS